LNERRTIRNLRKNRRSNVPVLRFAGAARGAPRRIEKTNRCHPERSAAESKDLHLFCAFDDQKMLEVLRLRYGSLRSLRSAQDDRIGFFEPALRAFFRQARNTGARRRKLLPVRAHQMRKLPEAGSQLIREFEKKERAFVAFARGRLAPDDDAFDRDAAQAQARVHVLQRDRELRADGELPPRLEAHASLGNLDRAARAVLGIDSVVEIKAGRHTDGDARGLAGDHKTLKN